MAAIQEKEPTSVFGAMLRDARKRKGWSLELVGEHVGVARTTVGEWEVGKGTRSVRAEKVKALSDVLEIPFDALFDAAMERVTQHVKELEEATPERFSPQDRVFLQRLKQHNPTEEDYAALLSLMEMMDRHRGGPPAPTP